MVFRRTTLALAFILLLTGRLQAFEISSVPAVQVSTFSVEVSTQIASTYTWRTQANYAFSVGEDLHFVVKWGLVVAGYSDLAVKELLEVDHRSTYHIVSTARSGGMASAFYKVQDKNDVWLDEQALVTVRYEKRIHEGKYQIEQTTLLDHINHHWKTRSYRLDKNIYEEIEGEMPENVLDAFGSLYYVRTLPLEVGHAYTFDVHEKDKVYPLLVQVLKKETLKVPAGKFDCIRLAVFLRGPGIFVAKGKKLEVWLTDDATHTPVRMRSEIFIGHVSADLLPKEEKDTDAAQ